MTSLRLRVASFNALWLIGPASKAWTPAICPLNQESFSSNSVTFSSNNLNRRSSSSCCSAMSPLRNSILKHNCLRRAAASFSRGPVFASLIKAPSFSVSSASSGAPCSSEATANVSVRINISRSTCVCWSSTNNDDEINGAGGGAGAETGFWASAALALACSFSISNVSCLPYSSQS